MLFEQTSLQGSGKEIVQKVVAAQLSQLLIPPAYALHSFKIPNPPDDGEKYIGLFSSGTTGTPVCIWNKLENLELNARLSAKMFEVRPSDFCLMLAKPWHVAGFSWMLMAEFIDCEYLFVTTHKGDHNIWLKTLQDVSPDYLFTVPKVLRALYDEYWFIDKIVFGGSSIKYNEYERLAPHCRYMYQAYGQTEAGGLISCHKRKSTVIPELTEHLCHGKSIPGAYLTSDGSSRDPGPIILQSITAICTEPYNTGDLGYLDENKNLHITGRQ